MFSWLIHSSDAHSSQALARLKQESGARAWQGSKCLDRCCCLPGLSVVGSRYVSRGSRTPEWDTGILRGSSHCTKCLPHSIHFEINIVLSHNFRLNSLRNIINLPQKPSLNHVVFSSDLRVIPFMEKKLNVCLRLQSLQYNPHHYTTIRSPYCQAREDTQGTEGA